MFWAWIAKQIEWLKSFLSDEYPNSMAGKASSQRLFETAVITAFLIAYLRVTFALIIMAPTAGAAAPLALLDIPWGWATVLMGILGLKVYQKKQQDDNETTVKMGGKEDPTKPTQK